MGRLSNLASLLKKVLGGREGERELPKTDWRVLGCSERKLLKLTNCWLVEGGRELKDCWPGKLTGPPVGRAWPDWNCPPKKVNGCCCCCWGGILVWVWPSCVWALKKVFWKF